MPSVAAIAITSDAGQALSRPRPSRRKTGGMIPRRNRAERAHGCQRLTGNRDRLSSPQLAFVEELARIRVATELRDAQREARGELFRMAVEMAGEPAQNFRQLASARCGAGSIRASRRIAHTVLAAREMPGPTSSQWTRR
jgi:hypothetical protein